jgi:DNA polymerase type B, organellar and viral
MKKNNSKFKFLHFSYEDFTKNNFENEIMKNFKLNTTYSILLKISSGNHLNFKMCGPQIGIIIENEHNLELYSKLYEIILTRIETVVENYNYIDTVDGLEIMYKIIKPQKELSLKNISKYNLNTRIVKVKETKKNFNQNLLPLTIDTSYYGISVIPEERNKYIQLINSNIHLSKFEKDFNINDSDKLFLFTNKKNKKFIVVSKKLEENKYLRFIFDRHTGIFILKMKDTIINSNITNNNKILFNRTIGNVTLTIEDQNVQMYKAVTELKAIQAFNKQIKDRNVNFGTFDLESFKDNDGLAKVYALGFFTNIDTSPNLYYLSEDPDLNSENLILKCINDMLINKYNKFIFYVHNLGHYDIVFLYNILLKTNLDKGFDYYILNTTMRDNTIIKLDIKIKADSNKEETNKNRYIKISFVDSINILNASLDKLTKEFNVEFRKGKFPHSFVNRNTLNYIGDKPSIFFYDNINHTEYDMISQNNWDLKSECLKYLNIDIKSLFQIMSEFSRLIYIHFYVQMTDALTITRLALNIFKAKYYSNRDIPSINQIYLFNFIKEGYYGGITEVYKPYGTNLIYIDVNSLYPYASLNPMPGTECTYMESFDVKGLDLDPLFGFFYAKVKTKNIYIGLLPVHKDGQLICPNGEYDGIWSSEELKFAKSKGYEITVIKGYNFNKIDNIFKDYVTELFNLKKNSTGVLKLIYKSLLNNFLGRFGLNIIKPVTQTVDMNRRDYISSTRIVHSHSVLNENKILITYDPIISKEICLQHGLDITKVLEKESKLNIESKLDLFKDVSIATAAFVTSYARIHMNKFKLEILENGGSIYYSDTDSAVLDKIYFNPNWIGANIGLFKLEYEIKEAYFISNKTYCLILNNGETIIKTKGVINNSLTVEHFKSMFWDNKNVTATKFNTITDYKKASVLIEKKDVILNHDSYKKREKIYNNEGIWIDTKPLLLNNSKNK